MLPAKTSIDMTRTMKAESESNAITIPSGGGQLPIS